jgi:hypothetical protein
MALRMYSVERPRTPPPSKESKHSPLVLSGLPSWESVAAADSSIVEQPVTNYVVNEISEDCSQNAYSLVGSEI